MHFRYGTRQVGTVMLQQTDTYYKETKYCFEFNVEFTRIVRIWMI